MTAARITTSNSGAWSRPRALDPSMRMMVYGKIRPMEDKPRSLLALLGLR